jgi:uncharacterized membrane protein
MRSAPPAASLFPSTGAPVADAQALPPAQRVPELAWQVVPEVFACPADWVVGDASGAAVKVLLVAGVSASMSVAGRRPRTARRGAISSARYRERLHAIHAARC